MGVGQLSRANRERILRCIWEDGPLSRITIGRRTNLAPATVNRLTASLVDAGLVREAGSDLTTGGRPSLVLEFNERAALILTVDVADEHTDVAFVDLRSEIVERTRHDARGHDAQARVDQVVRLVAEALTQPLAGAVIAVGISIPGPVDPDGTVVFAPSLEWHDVPLRRMIATLTSLPIRVENDANLIAVAEQSLGSWRGTSSLVAIAVFNGIGSGIVEDGQLWRGASGAAGQIGRMLVDTRSLDREYAGFGDLETHLGLRGLVARAAARGLLDPTTGRTGIDDLFRDFEKGDRAAVEFLSQVFDQFALSLVNLCALLSPEVIVFAGLFDTWSPVVLPELASRLRDHVVYMPQLEPVSVGEHSALLGAAWLAFESAGSLESLVDMVAAAQR